MKCVTSQFQSPITGKQSTLFSKTWALLSNPISYLLAALLFPLPTSSAFGTEQIFTLIANRGPLSSVPALPQECHVERLDHVLDHLQQSERKEVDPWLRDDIRIAWIAIYTADIKGEFENGWDAVVSASYRVIGVHPNKVWAKIQHNRQIRLRHTYPLYRNPVTGQLLLNFDAPVVPRKPNQSVRNKKEKLA